MSEVKNMNGVNRKSDGLLLRYGLCDFTTDGSFDPDTEEQHDATGYSLYIDPCGIPYNPKVTKWDGNTWILIDRVKK